MGLAWLRDRHLCTACKGHSSVQVLLVARYAASILVLPLGAHAHVADGGRPPWRVQPSGCHLVVVANEHEGGTRPVPEHLEHLVQRLHRQRAAGVPEVTCDRSFNEPCFWGN